MPMEGLVPWRTARPDRSASAAAIGGAGRQGAEQVGGAIVEEGDRLRHAVSWEDVAGRARRAAIDGEDDRPGAPDAVHGLGVGEDGRDIAPAPSVATDAVRKATSAQSRLR